MMVSTSPIARMNGAASSTFAPMPLNNNSGGRSFGARLDGDPQVLVEHANHPRVDDRLGVVGRPRSGGRLGVQVGLTR